MSQTQLEPKLSIEEDNIVIKDGKVVRIEHWVVWSGAGNWKAISVQRMNTGFFQGNFSSPDGGGPALFGTLREAMYGMHPDVIARFSEPFNLENATPEAILALNEFKNYKVVVL